MLDGSYHSPGKRLWTRTQIIHGGGRASIFFKDRVEQFELAVGAIDRSRGLVQRCVPGGNVYIFRQTDTTVSIDPSRAPTSERR